MKYKFHEGQRVLIVGNSIIPHFAIIGGVGTIMGTRRYGNLPCYHIQCKTTSGCNYQTIIENDLVAVGAKVV